MYDERNGDFAVVADGLAWIDGCSGRGWESRSLDVSGVVISAAVSPAAEMKVNVDADEEVSDEMLAAGSERQRAHRLRFPPGGGEPSSRKRHIAVPCYFVGSWCGYDGQRNTTQSGREKVEGKSVLATAQGACCSVGFFQKSVCWERQTMQKRCRVRLAQSSSLLIREKMSDK